MATWNSLINTWDANPNPWDGMSYALTVNGVTSTSLAKTGGVQHEALRVDKTSGTSLLLGGQQTSYDLRVDSVSGVSFLAGEIDAQELFVVATAQVSFEAVALSWTPKLPPTGDGWIEEEPLQ